MMCANCAKLAYLYNKKACLRCQGEIIINIAVICEVCSAKEKNCSVCLKKMQSPASRNGGCGCGKK